MSFVTTNFDSSDVSVLLGQGDGTFQAEQRFAVGFHPAAVAVADFNGDGRPDLVTANFDSRDVSLLLGQGNGTFQTAQQFSVGFRPAAVAVADFNGDGSADIAILTREKGTNKGGILIIHGTTNESIVLGAGSSFSNGGDDFSWMDAWSVYPRGVVRQGATEEQAPPVLSGDALMVVKLEAASAIVYWTGTEYTWYQQGD